MDIYGSHPIPGCVTLGEGYQLFGPPPFSRAGGRNPYLPCLSGLSDRAGCSVFQCSWGPVQGGADEWMLGSFLRLPSLCSPFPHLLTSCASQSLFVSWTTLLGVPVPRPHWEPPTLCVLQCKEEQRTEDALLACCVSIPTSAWNIL